MWTNSVKLTIQIASAFSTTLASWNSDRGLQEFAFARTSNEGKSLIFDRKAR